MKKLLLQTPVIAVLLLCLFSSIANAQVIVETFESNTFASAGGTYTRGANYASTSSNQTISIQTAGAATKTFTTDGNTFASLSSMTWGLSSATTTNYGTNNWQIHSTVKGLDINDNGGYLVTPIISSGITSVTFWMSNTSGASASLRVGLKTNVAGTASTFYPTTAFFNSLTTGNTGGAFYQYSVATSTYLKADGFPGTAGKYTFNVAGTNSSVPGQIIFVSTGAGGGGHVILDDIVINTTAVPLPTIFYSKGNLAPNTLANWNSARDGSGVSPTNFTTSGNTFIVQGTGGGLSAPHNMTSGSTMTFGAGVKLVVESGATLTQNSNITMDAAATFQLNAGATFVQNSTSASGISAGIENWNVGSTVVYTNTGVISSANITGNSHPNVTFQMGSNTGLGGVFADVAGNPAVAGNLIVDQGAGKYISLVASSGNATATVNGNVTITSGILNLSTGSSAGTLNVKGDFNITSSGSFQTNATTGANALNFAKSGTLVFTNDGTIGARPVNVTINNGCTVDFGTSTLDNLTGTFNLSSGGGVITKDPDGFSTTAATGTIQVTGTKTYNAAANYTYNGASAQVAGNGLTGASTLTINNSAGVTLSAATAVTSSLALTSGKLTLGANNLTLTGASITGASSSNYIVTNSTGSVVRSIATGGGTFAFPIGRSASAYNPVTVTNTSGATSVYTVSTSATTFPSAANGANAQWSVAASAATTSTLAFQWITADAGANLAASPTSGQAYKNVSGTFAGQGGTTTGTPNVTTITGVTTLAGPLWTVAKDRVDGVISAGEYGTHTNGSNQQSSATGTWYMSWDATNLYVGVTGNSAEGSVLYLDKNPIAPVNGGTNADGSLVGNTYDGSNFNPLQFRADLVVYFKDGYKEYRTADGAGGWTGSITSFGTYASAGSNVQEIAIPWSVIGGQPASFNWFGYKAYTGGGTGVYNSVPTENPGSGGGTFVGTSAKWERYYTVSSTSTPTLPFSQNSFVFNSASDKTGVAAMSVYDFTMNTVGRLISRSNSASGAWSIAGNMTVGNGTVYMGGTGGSGYGTTNIAGNLTVAGGTVDNDYNTNPINVAGNVTISSGTLALSNTAPGDIKVNGNWDRSASGTFTPRNRAVFFTGATASTIIAPETDGTVRDANGSFGGETFPYLIVNKTAKANTVKLLSNVVVTKTLTLTKGTLDLDTSDVVLPSNASVTADVAAIEPADVDITYSATGRFLAQRYIGSTSSKRSWRYLTAPFLASDPITINDAWQEGQANPVATTPEDTNPWPGFGTHITGPAGAFDAAKGFDDGGLQSKYSIQYYDNSAASPKWSYPANTKSTALMSKLAWVVFIRGDRSIKVNDASVPANNTTLEPKGKINVGQVTSTIVASKTNVVGNPYPCQINMIGVNIGGSTNQDFKLWDPAAYTNYTNTGKYVFFNENGGTYDVNNGPTTTWVHPGTVESSEAFLTYNDVTGSSVIFHEADKVTGQSTNNGLQSRPLATPNGKFQSDLQFLDPSVGRYVNISGSNAYFNSSFSSAVVAGEDRVSPVGTALGELRILKDGQQLSTSREPIIASTDTIFLYLSKANQVAHRLVLSTKYFVPNAQAILVDKFLNDKETNVTISNADSTFYDFDITDDPQSNRSDRFMVVFRPIEGPLPVKFSSVKAAEQQGGIRVQWQVETEINTKSYEVEKSVDGVSYTKVITVTSNNTAGYNWLDATPNNDNNYYRIRSIDQNGIVTYSQVVTVKTNREVSGIAVYPNPVVGGVVTLQLNNMTKGKYGVRVINNLGQTLLKKTIQHLGGSATETLSLVNIISQGVYKLEVSKPDNKVIIINLAH